VPRRHTPSQLRSHLRQIEARQRQLDGQYNQRVARYNSAVREFNAKLNSAINQYNQSARRHNANVASNRQRVNAALLRLQSSARSRPTLSSSTMSLRAAYTHFEARMQREGLAEGREFVALAERESANSIDVLAAIDAPQAPADDSPAIDSELGGLLDSVSPDLGQRWRGALYALHPQNPDAARHFCASTREIFVQILDDGAPDEDVLGWKPECGRTQEGRPRRREKINYLTTRSGAAFVAEFPDQNIENIMDLFGELNEGTHGSAGRFGLSALLAIKTRVEDGIAFLLRVIGGRY